ncbi:hypothetical protein [Halocola ammonii]
MKSEEQILDYQELERFRRKWTMFRLRIYTLVAAGVVMFIFFRILYLFVIP